MWGSLSGSWRPVPCYFVTSHTTDNIKEKTSLRGFSGRVRHSTLNTVFIRRWFKSVTKLFIVQEVCAPVSFRQMCHISLLCCHRAKPEIIEDGWSLHCGNAEFIGLEKHRWAGAQPTVLQHPRSILLIHLEKLKRFQFIQTSLGRNSVVSFFSGIF